MEIEYEGEVAQLNTQPLTAVALASLMRPLMPDVNMVSAPAVLKQRGTPLTESKRETSPIYGSLIRIKVLTGGSAGARSPGSSTRARQRSSRSRAWPWRRISIR